MIMVNPNEDDELFHQTARTTTPIASNQSGQRIITTRTLEDDHDRWTTPSVATTTSVDSRVGSKRRHEGQVSQSQTPHDGHPSLSLHESFSSSLSFHETTLATVTSTGQETTDCQGLYQHASPTRPVSSPPSTTASTATSSSSTASSSPSSETWMLEHRMKKCRLGSSFGEICLQRDLQYMVSEYVWTVGTDTDDRTGASSPHVARTHVYEYSRPKQQQYERNHPERMTGCVRTTESFPWKILLEHASPTRLVLTIAPRQGNHTHDSSSSISDGRHVRCSILIPRMYPHAPPIMKDISYYTTSTTTTNNHHHHHTTAGTTTSTEAPRRRPSIAEIVIRSQTPAPNNDTTSITASGQDSASSSHTNTRMHMTTTKNNQGVVIFNDWSPVQRLHQVLDSIIQTLLPTLTTTTVVDETESMNDDSDVSNIGITNATTTTISDKDLLPPNRFDHGYDRSHRLDDVHQTTMALEWARPYQQECGDSFHETTGTILASSMDWS